MRSRGLRERRLPRGRVERSDCWRHRRPEHRHLVGRANRASSARAARSSNPVTDPLTSASTPTIWSVSLLKNFLAIPALRSSDPDPIQPMKAASHRPPRRASRRGTRPLPLPFPFCLERTRSKSGQPPRQSRLCVAWHGSPSLPRTSGRSASIPLAPPEAGLEARPESRGSWGGVDG